MSSDTPHAFRMPPRASSFRTNSAPSVPPAPPATATATTAITATAVPIRNYGDKFKKAATAVGATAGAGAAPVPVSISSFTEFPSLRKVATVATATTTAATTANQAVTPVTSWAVLAQVAHEKDLARIKKEQIAEAERLAEEEKERIRNTIHRVGIHTIRASTMSASRREDEWTDEGADEGADEGGEPYEDEEGMGYVPTKYSEGGYVANKYTEGGYVANKYTDSGTPPYSPFDQNEVGQGIVEND